LLTINRFIENSADYPIPFPENNFQSVLVRILQKKIRNFRLKEENQEGEEENHELLT